MVLMGRRLDMARRARRRALVVWIYAALAGLIAAVWSLSHWHGSGAYIIWAALIACRFFLGGYYRGGLVKPFQYRRPMREDAAPSLPALKLRMYRPVLASDEAGMRNDERELHQRDRAHYLAYQAMGMAVVLLALVASMRTVLPPLRAWIRMPADELYYGLALITLTLFLTLPQAILMWTEPDMEQGQGIVSRE